MKLINSESSKVFFRSGRPLSTLAPDVPALSAWLPTGGVLEAQAQISDKMRPVRVLVTTTQWAGAERVVTAFARSGCHIEVLCLHRNLLAQMHAVRRLHRHNPFRPLAALARAITGSAPDLIVPCDDPAAGHLRDLYAQTGGSRALDRLTLIANSIGNPAIGPVARSRAVFAKLAREAGVRAPPTCAIRDMSSLRAAADQTGFPAMLKVDGTWGGAGVARANTLTEAEHLFRALSARPRTLGTFKRLAVHRDLFQFMRWLRGDRPTVNLQAFVPGRPANCAVSCHEGKVLAMIQAEAIRTSHATGPAAMVRIVEHPEITETVHRLVAHFSLSGFCGFDFVIDPVGAAHVIEMNPRITPLGSLAFDGDRDPVGAWVAAQGGQSIQRQPTNDAKLVAFFPQAWWLAAGNADLASAYQDVPWSEPDLLRALVRLPPWGRGRIARLLKGNRGPEWTGGVLWEGPVADAPESHSGPGPTTTSLHLQDCSFLPAYFEERAQDGV